MLRNVLLCHAHFWLRVVDQPYRLCYSASYTKAGVPVVSF